MLFLALVAGGLVYAFMPKPVEVELENVKRGPIQMTINEGGKTRIKERYVVSAPLAGRLLRVELHPGDCVEAGTTLITAIEPTDPALLDPRARAEAEARVKASEALRERAEPALAKARAEHEVALTDLNRVRALVESNAASRQDLDNAELRHKTAAEALKTAEFDRKIAEFELELAQAVLIQADPRGGKTEAQRFEILSPVNGRVLRVMQESATIVAPGTPLIEVGDTADLEVEIDALSSDAVKITPGDVVLFDDWGGTGTLEGRVRLVEPAAFTKVSSLGVEEQRVYVIADFTDPLEVRGRLGEGFRVEARIVIHEEWDTPTLPAGALFRQGDAWAVFVADEGRARLRKVEIGARNDTAAQVLSGVNTGDRVIVYPSDRVRDGVSIRER